MCHGAPFAGERVSGLCMRSQAAEMLGRWSWGENKLVLSSHVYVKGSNNSSRRGIAMGVDRGIVECMFMPLRLERCVVRG